MKSKENKDTQSPKGPQFHEVINERFADIEQTLAVALNMILSAEEQLEICQDEVLFELHSGIIELTKGLLKAKDSQTLSKFWGLK